MKPPKDYAKELVQSYRLVSLKMSMKDAKACALVAVEFALKAAFYAKDEIYQYYLQVKTEIINLK